jgi:hypothetical protein
MDGLASLLTGTSDATSRGYRSLPQDKDSWASVITGLVYKVIPPDLPIQASVHMNQVDEINGFGIGSVHLANQDGEVKAFLPIVVRRFKLAPLDVIVSNDKFKPLSENLVRRLFSNDEMTEGLADKKDLREYSDQDLTSLTTPPAQGMYNYASDRSGFLSTISEDDQTAFRSLLSKDATVLGELNALNKTAHVQGLLAVPEQEKVAATRDLITTWEKLAEGKYRILTSDGTFGPKVVEVDEKGLRVSIKDADPENKDQLLDRVHRESAVTRSELDKREDEDLANQNLNEGPAGSEVLLYRVDKAEPKVGDEHSMGFAMTSAGAKIRGVLFTNVIGLNGKKVDTKLFVGRGVSGIQPKIAIEPTSGKLDMQSDFQDTMPKVGETGTMVHFKDQSAVALVPVTIRSVRVSPDPNPTAAVVVLNATTMLGDEVVLSISPTIKGIVETTPKGSKRGKKRYTISSSFHWLPMGDFKEFVTTPDMMKNATDFEKKAMASKARIINTGIGYCLQAPWVKVAEEDTGMDFGCLSTGEISHVLAGLGCHTKTAAGILRIADARPSVTVIGLRHGEMKKTAKEKTIRVRGKMTGPAGAVVPVRWAKEQNLGSAMADEEKLSSIRARVKVVTPMVVRFSREIEKRGGHKDTVDTVLDLNFLNPQNISYFTSLVPKFDDTIDALSKLLVAARVGLPEIEEDSVRATLKNLTSIKDDLRDLTYSDEAE